MAQTSPAAGIQMGDQLDKLVAYEPQEAPIVSLYLNLAPDQHGRDNYEAFVRKAFSEHLKAFKESSAERASLERDLERITKYLSEDVNRAANGLALFASSGAGEFFEAMQLDVPIPEHWMFVGAVPHLYPLARVIDQYPTYAAVVLDTNLARIIVFGLGAAQRKEEVTSDKTRRSSVGGWSQARYQRRADNMHLQHIKEVVETLERVVREDNIKHIIVAGDAVALPLLKEQMPKHLHELLIEELSLATGAPDAEIVSATMEVLRKKDAETDAEVVSEMIGAWQAGGLAVMGPEAALRALQMGQVEELVITGSAADLKPVKLPEDSVTGEVKAETSAPLSADERQLELAGELVTRAQQTAARVRFIEDPSLLQDFGGVGAVLRFRI